MKCQKCGFVSFDDLKSCKKCGASPSLPERDQDLTSGGDKSVLIQEKPKGDAQGSLLPSNFDETIESIKQDLDAIDGSLQKGTSADADSKDQKNIDVLNKTASLQSIDSLTQEKKAGFMLRLVAYTVDNVILYVISSVLLIVAGYFVTGSVSLGEIYNANTAPPIFYLCIIACIFIEIFYFTYFYGVTGQTVGKWICGIRVVGTDGKIIGFKRAFVRFCGYFVSSIPLCFGFFWIIFDKKKQGWHDKIAGTCVIRVSK